ncbi:MAG TPA: twin-arginine translocase subunit TatC [Pirellulales bacterium]|jgi:sec-independent protein translocase protein TatC|nr:twin-arginine translocase subunit TatC [Pirellulales bacterium]
MARNDEDDLFKHTSMTFGEHLEELRACLLKSVVSLGIGFGLGLFVAPWIVQFIQSPLEKALANYYSEEAVEYINARVPTELRDDPAIQKLVFEDGLVPQEAYVAPGDMLSELQKRYPHTFEGLKLPPADGAPAGSHASSGSSTAVSKRDLMPLFIWKPLSDDDRLKLKAMNVQESFMIYIKAAFLFGALASSPLVFYFLWSFVAAGLYPHEKKYVHTFLPASVGLFLCGAILAFTLVFPPVLAFFFSVTKSMGQVMEPRISEWLSFVLLLPLGFGVSFQLPLLMLFLERIHVFTVQLYLAKWRIAVLLMAIAAMVLSPGGDPNSMLMMFVPLVCLYFGGIGLCKWLPSNRGVPAVTDKSKAYASSD